MAMAEDAAHTWGPNVVAACPQSHPAICYLTVRIRPSTVYSNKYKRKWVASGNSLGAGVNKAIPAGTGRKGSLVTRAQAEPHYSLPEKVLSTNTDVVRVVCVGRADCASF